jgi:hypothetical protein
MSPAKAETVVGSIVTIGVIILLFQLIIVVALALTDKVPALLWFSFSVIINVCFMAMVSLEAAATTQQGLSSTYGKLHISLLQILRRSMHTIYNDSGWTWIFIIYGIAACTTVLHGFRNHDHLY